MTDLEALSRSVAWNLVAAPLVVAALGALAEPWRRRVSVAMLLFATFVYLRHNLGLWELGFATALLLCAMSGARSYRAIGIGWLVHTLSDVFHHAANDPMISAIPLSSFGCAIFDPLLAIWYFADAPSTSSMWHAVGTTLRRGGEAP